MNVVVLLNAAAGSVRGAPDLPLRVTEAFAKAGAKADVRAVPPDELPLEARAAMVRKVDAVVAAGGDGTLATIAAALAGTGMPMGVLPLGTLNHFAKDIGVPLDLEAAAAAIVNGVPRDVDIGEVNGHVFLNNSSLGLYPRMVRLREERGHHHRIGKIVATFWAGIAALKQFPTLAVRVHAGRETKARRTPVIFVGNNRYQSSFLKPASREAIDRGELSLFIANWTGRLGILRLATRALFGRLDAAKDFEVSTVTEVWVHTRKRVVSVATDGELTRMRTPLHYIVRPRCLRILVPPPTAPPQTEAT